MTQKILIGVPARDTVMTGFAHAITTLVACTAVSADIEVRLTFSAGTLICDQRDKLAKEAIDCGADALLFVDSDMRFPADALLRLLAHDVPIVAANYTTRRVPPEPVAFERLATAEKLWTRPDSTGLEECAAVGMGLMLIRTDVLKAMEKPRFFIPYIAAIDGHWGEDVWFCNQARKAGYGTLIDHDLSKEVKHIGLREYDYLDAECAREEVQDAWRAGQGRADRQKGA
jgi:hypothetical protein